MKEDKPAIMARMVAHLPPQSRPTDEVLALGDLMRNWLQTEMSDNGEAVDSGAGMQCYDLWVRFGGKELYINIRPSKVVV